MFLRNAALALSLFATVALTSSCIREPPGTKGGGQKPDVTLKLTSATVERLSNNLLFICDAVIDNRTGAELAVKSSFYSAFDGLELVIMDEKGHKLAQQSYLQHQSLFSLTPRKFPLKEGQNRQELRFPVAGLPRDRREYRVLLVGRLPGSNYAKTLCSDQVTVKVKQGD